MWADSEINEGTENSKLGAQVGGISLNSTQSTHTHTCAAVYLCRFCFASYLSRSLADRYVTTVDYTTSFLHSSRFSAFSSSIFHSRPVHSLMLSSIRFLCLPLCLPPWTVPCRIVLASANDRVSAHTTSVCVFSLKWGGLHTARWRFQFWLHFLIGSMISVRDTEEFAETSHLQYLYPLSMSAVMVHISHAYKNMDKAREHISLIMELMEMWLSFQMTFSLATASVVWAILDSTSGLNPSSLVL